MITGCRSEIIDTSSLNDYDQALFAEAAELEGIETTQNRALRRWFVVYDPLMKEIGYAIPIGVFCKISVRTKNMYCSNGGYDQRFRIVARHEIRHCFGVQHSTNRASLMFPTPSCWPADY